MKVMKLDIRYDFNGLMADRIGSEGLKVADIAKITPRLDKARQAIAGMRKNKELGFFELPYDKKLVSKIERLADKLKRFHYFVVIGIGGSALGNIALHTALSHPYYNEISRKKRGSRPAIYICDNIDPERLKALLDVIDIKKTVFNVISKSGDTAEIASTFTWLRSVVEKKVGKKKVSSHFVITTDEKKGALRDIVRKEKFERLVVPDGVGGRFSVLSAVGLLSAAVEGISIRELLSGAAAMDKACKTSSVKKNPALMGAGYHYLMDVKKAKNIQVMMPYSNALKDVSDWFRQLWAESLGKAVDKNGKKVNVGQTPCKSLGVTDQHSQVQLYMEGPNDKVMTFLSVDRFKETITIPSIYKKMEKIGYLAGHTINELFDAERAATELALQKAGRPTCAIRLPVVSAYTVGALLFLLELQTAYAGELYNINAFNQPGVELGKQYAYGMMGRSGFEEKADEVKKAAKPVSAFIVSV